MSVSIKLGGTTIPKPEEKADLNYLVSTCECSHLIDALKGKESFDPVFSHRNNEGGSGGNEEEEVECIG